MTKKLLSVLMAVVLCFGMFAVAVYAEDTTEPEEPETPVEAYVPVEYNIEDILARFEADEDVILMPTDIIRLPGAATDDPDEPEDPEEVTAEEEGEGETAEISSVLIVEYLPGEDAESLQGISKFLDFQGSGYAVRGLQDSTDFVVEKGQQESGATYAIDYENAEGYAFKSWSVTGVYSGKEFNRLVLTANWDKPVLSGWAGFKALMRGYLKTFIDYLTGYLIDLADRIGAYLV